jgi:hypothetical protein
MAITSPFQPVHPIEYYGDEFRKSVGISWDLRLDDPYIFSSRSKSAVAAMFLEQCQQAKIESTHPLVKFTSNTLYQVQLHISSPVLFFGDHYE